MELAKDMAFVEVEYHFNPTAQDKYGARLTLHLLADDTGRLLDLLMSDRELFGEGLFAKWGLDPDLSASPMYRKSSTCIDDENWEELEESIAMEINSIKDKLALILAFNSSEKVKTPENRRIVIQL